MAEANLVHPTALVESFAIGEGTRIWAFAHVMEGAVLGENCKIGDHAFIESGARLGNRVTVKNGCLIWHGVHIGDDVFVGPNVVFTNDVRPRVGGPTGPDAWIRTRVEDGASIGANTTIVCGVALGARCMVGAGSVVTRDVPAHGLVFGNPARQHGWVCSCGADLNESLECSDCGQRYRLAEGGLGFE